MPDVADIRTDLPAGPHWEVAPLEARFGAMLIDFAVIVVAALVAVLVLSVPGRSLDMPDEAYTEMLMGVGFGLAAFGYRLGMEGRSGPGNGQTLGKRVTRIRTIQADGTPGITAPQAAARALLIAPFAAAGFALVPLLVAVWPDADPGNLAALAGIYGLAVTGLTAAASVSRRAWHDRICGTLVVRVAITAAPPGRQHVPWVAGPQPYGAPQPYAAQQMAPAPPASSAAPMPCDAPTPPRFVPPPPAPYGSQPAPAPYGPPPVPAPSGYPQQAVAPVAPAPAPAQPAGPPPAGARLPVRGSSRSWVSVVLLAAVVVMFATSDELQPEPREAGAAPQQQVGHR